VVVIAVALATGAAGAGTPVADPSGSSTGSAIDVPAKVPGQPTLEELAAAVGHNRIAINLMWTLLAGALVMFMQAGFAMVETGFTRAKNASHTMLMNFLIYCIGMLGYWMVGFGLQMGGVGGAATLGGGAGLAHEFTLKLLGKEFGLWGTTGFFLTGVAYDVAVFTLFLFQMVFMDTAATIPTGAMAERWKLLPFVVYGFFISMFTYPLFANWVWGGGWLAALGRQFGLGHGYLDFAGSSVVHMTGGVTALAGALVLGPRIGKFNRDGTPNAIPGHDIPMALLGTFILAFGWFGFNAGSTLAGGDLRIGVIATNTMLASGAGALAATLYLWLRSGRPETGMAANGMLAGLVAITAPCAFVNAPAAVAIGLVAGLLVVWSSAFLERVWKVDDPVGAISVHGTCGAWGVVALGLFADGTYGDGVNGIAGGVRGLLYGDPGQLIAQLIGPVANVLFIFGVSWLFFKTLDALIGMRVPPEAEVEGLDFHEVGTPGYPEQVPALEPAPAPIGGGAG